MALYTYIISIPKKIMEGSSEERQLIEVQARSYKQATSRAKNKAIEQGWIISDKDWRWERRRIEGVK